MQVLFKAWAGPAEPGPATRAVPAAGPGNAPARHNLEVLLRATGQCAEDAIVVIQSH